MEEKNKAIVESILFSTGKEVEIKDLSIVLEKSPEEVIKIVNELKEDYSNSDRGIEIIKVKDAYQMCSKKEFYDYIEQATNKNIKPSLSNASMETLSIIAYNPEITRAEIEAIRGVNCDGTIYKLLEFGLIEEAGRLDAPGRPTTYVTSNKFLKMFGLNNLEELPELPKYKLDENGQIIIEDQLKDKEEIISTEENDSVSEGE